MTFRKIRYDQKLEITKVIVHTDPCSRSYEVTLKLLKVVFLFNLIHIFNDVNCEDYKSLRCWKLNFRSKIYVKHKIFYNHTVALQEHPLFVKSTRTQQYWLRTVSADEKRNKHNVAERNSGHWSNGVLGLGRLVKLVGGKHINANNKTWLRTSVLVR